jgi:hypothetical protein
LKSSDDDWDSSSDDYVIEDETADDADRHGNLRDFVVADDEMEWEEEEVTGSGLGKKRHRRKHRRRAKTPEGPKVITEAS